MKKLLSILSLTISLTAFAQVPLSGSFTDCNNNSKDIQATLGTGKAIIIAHKGVDCSICVSQAPSLQTWAGQNKSKVEVWTALTWKYNPMTFSNACQSTNNWLNAHSWSDIFTFPDNSRQFINSSTPRYYVYSPIDSSIAYNGTNRNTAYSTALQLSTVGIEQIVLERNITTTVKGSVINISNSTGQNIELSIYNVQGSLIRTTSVFNQSTIDLSGQSTGILILQFRSAEAAFSKKVFIQD